MKFVITYYTFEEIIYILSEDPSMEGRDINFIGNISVKMSDGSNIMPFYNDVKVSFGRKFNPSHVPEIYCNDFNKNKIQEIIFYLSRIGDVEYHWDEDKIIFQDHEIGGFVSLLLTSFHERTI